MVRTDRMPAPSIALGEIAAALEPTKTSRHGREPGLAAEGWFDVAHQVYPYGSHAAVVRVDRGTGAVAVERYVIGYDIGRAINPMLVKGQIVGGFVQGIGGALLEEFTYSERGDPLAVTFADYLLPTVVHCDSPEAAIAKKEFMFPFVTVVECPEARMLDAIGPTLVCTAITCQPALRRRLTDAVHIDRLNLGPVPTTRLNWLQPHEGNIVEFLFRARAFQTAEIVMGSGVIS